MKKEKKTNRINFRYSNEEWAFYQSLKESGLKRFMMRLAMLSKLIDNKIDVIFIKSVEFYIIYYKRKINK